MTIKRKELIYIGLTLVLLGILGFSYLALNKKSSSSQVQSTPTAKLSTQIPSQLEQLLADLEKDPSREKLAKAQIEVNKLTNNSQKETLQNRLNKVKAKLNLVDSTEKALINAENSPSEKTIKAAQAAINRISIPSKKAEFQKRLDRVKNRLSKESSEETTSSDSSSQEQTSDESSNTSSEASSRESESSSASTQAAEETSANLGTTTTDTPVYPTYTPPAVSPSIVTPSTPVNNETPASSLESQTSESVADNSTEVAPSETPSEDPSPASVEGTE
ncbi:GA-like domain-containing protein [Streptococcus cuniculipharyngis]|uniref:Minor extracellular protease Epr GA-like domain-containing protein n=1 Tax=Streptococcus cuniculipharyngis TaxID=1562651 RepID=A0A5C5S9I1_9STRE|nr:hypothetical protein [Streptococcus cuniculipharyngis]TWS96670.1 hypothetical protein FRX57_06810 [Streptococcus cuniculipharyngis]